MADDFKAATNRMRGAAEAWHLASSWLTEAAGTTDGLKMTVAEAGVFAPSLSKYEPAPGYVNDRLKEAATACQAIADILNKAAKTYDEEDVARSQKFNSLG